VRGRPTSRLIGRINVHAPSIAPDGRLKMHLLAYPFFRAARTPLPPSS
jgi:hypothetical protein